MVPGTVQNVCFPGQTGDCTGLNNSFIPSLNEDTYSLWTQYNLRSGVDYIISWWAPCVDTRGDYYFSGFREWLDPRGDDSTWYFVSGPDGTDIDESAALMAQLPVDIPADGLPARPAQWPRAPSQAFYYHVRRH